MIVLLATLKAKPGQRDELARRLDAIRVDADDEPGTTYLEPVSSASR